ncbi:hypothetical protein M9H77_28221 [Catharanthus roseus]|uniref:Uncharacterized protein n=1 Tax=Catharanthus roseus TaxID=4058 RepID=A0ACC0AER4_CATRO|nr:hypothetical protein M9H77_28221 [Catharanthus roseus]
MHRSSAPYKVDPLERGRNTVEGLARLVLRQASHHALWWEGRLVESQEGLEIKLNLRTDLYNSKGNNEKPKDLPAAAESDSAANAAMTEANDGALSRCQWPRTASNGQQWSLNNGGLKKITEDSPPLSHLSALSLTQSKQWRTQKVATRRQSRTMVMAA